MYSPSNVPFGNLTSWLQQELARIAASWGQIDFLEFTVHHAAPAKPKAGRVYYADGTNWNPGGGEGLYLYLSNGTWQKL